MRKTASNSQAHPVSQTEPTLTPSNSKGWLQAFSSLRQRNFRLYWSSQLISLTGSAMQTLGQSWLVLELTHSPWQLGLVGALQFLPVLLFSLLGGVLADRWPKCPILLVTQSVSLLQALVLWILVVSGALQLWHLYLLVVLVGLTNTLDKPTRQVFVAEMVGRAELPNAVALNSSSFNLTRIIGPSLAGLILASTGVSMLFLINALSFMPVLVCLGLINSQQLPTSVLSPGKNRARPKLSQSLGEGLNYIWSNQVILLMIVVVGLVLLFGSNFSVVLPVFTTEVLKAGASGFGFLSAGLGVGALLSSLWLAWSHYRPTIPRLLVGALLFGLLEFGLGLSSNYWLALVFISSVGFAEIAFTSFAITLLQTLTPDQLRGRVISVYILFFDGSVPLGYLMTGSLSGLCGPSLTLVVSAFLSLLVTAGGWWWYRNGFRQLAQDELPIPPRSD
jgi:MFS family permease